MNRTRVALEDIISNHSKKQIIDKLENFIENVRYASCLWVFEYMMTELESSRNPENISLRTMMEKLFAEQIIANTEKTEFFEFLKSLKK